MVYPGLFPLLMFNYWMKRAKAPIVGIMISAFDTKHKGRVLPFYEEVPYFIRRSGLRYGLYLLFIAKLGAQLVVFWNLIRKLRGKKIKLKTFYQIAKEKNVPVFCSDDFNGAPSLNFIKRVNANLIVSAYNNQILRSRIINAPRFKVINIHPGYLPDFRGLDAPFEALYHNVEKAGVTIHYIDTGIDTGKIIRQELIRVRKNDTLFSLNVRLWMHGAEMLNPVLDMIEEHSVSARKQRPDKAKYPYKSYPEKERVVEFIKRGGRLISCKDLMRTFKG